MISILKYGKYIDIFLLKKKKMWKKCIAKTNLILQQKNVNVFENTLATTVNQFIVSKLIKLMILWTTGPRILKHLDPVVQSVVSLTSSLRVILLTVLADSIHNILIFFAEKMWVAYALQKLLTFFQQKKSAHLRITRC